jgi:hypothetical protein
MPPREGVRVLLLAGPGLLARGHPQPPPDLGNEGTGVQEEMLLSRKTMGSLDLQRMQYKLLITVLSAPKLDVREDTSERGRKEQRAVTYDIQRPVRVYDFQVSFFL